MTRTIGGSGCPKYDCAEALAVATWGERLRNLNYKRKGYYLARVDGEPREMGIFVEYKDGALTARLEQP